MENNTNNNIQSNLYQETFLIFMNKSMDFYLNQIEDFDVKSKTTKMNQISDYVKEITLDEDKKIDFFQNFILLQLANMCLMKKISSMDEKIIINKSPNELYSEILLNNQLTGINILSSDGKYFYESKIKDNNITFKLDENYDKFRNNIANYVGFINRMHEKFKINIYSALNEFNDSESASQHYPMNFLQEHDYDKTLSKEEMDFVINKLIKSKSVNDYIKEIMLSTLTSSENNHISSLRNNFIQNILKEELDIQSKTQKNNNVAYLNNNNYVFSLDSIKMNNEEAIIIKSDNDLIQSFNPSKENTKKKTLKNRPI